MDETTIKTNIDLIHDHEKYTQSLRRDRLERLGQTVQFLAAIQADLRTDRARLRECGDDVPVQLNMAVDFIGYAAWHLNEAIKELETNKDERR